MGHAVVMLSGRRIAVSKTMAVVAVSAVALIAVLVGAFGNPHAAAPAHPSSSQLQWAAKGAISSSLGRDQTAFYATHRSGGLIADNATQRLTAQFDRRGVLVRAGTTTFGLQLLAWGAPGHTTSVSPAAPRADANRVTYAHGPVTEWYANGPLGLEQGFDVRTPPMTTAGDRLAIVLGVQGNARTRADGHGGLSLTGPDGKHLSYTGLTATDARGHVLASSLTASGSRAVIHVDTAGAVYPLRIDPFIQVAKFSDPNPANQASLGSFDVDVQGTTAVAAVTAPTATTPPGAVDVFVANSGRWELGATRVAQLTGATDEAFGTSVALSADAKTIAVGAPSATVGMLSGEGKVYVFEQPAGGWTGTITTPTATLTGTPTGGFADSLGKSVSISSDASLIAAGAPGRASSPINAGVGAVLVFARPAMHWTNQVAPQATLTHRLGTTGDQLGFSVAMSGNGSTIVAGAPFGPNLTFLGEAAVFQQPPAGWADNNNPNASCWRPTARPTTSLPGGRDLRRRQDDRRRSDRRRRRPRRGVRVHLATDGNWTGAPAASATLTSSDGQQEAVGRSVATDGRVVVAGPFTAAVGGNMGQGVTYVFAEPAGGWASETETQKLVAGDGQGRRRSRGDGRDLQRDRDRVGVWHATSLGIRTWDLSTRSARSRRRRSRSRRRLRADQTAGTSIRSASPCPRVTWTQTVTAIRCVLDPAAAPIGFGALPAACAFLAPGAVAANGAHALFASAANAAGYAAAPVSRSFKIDTVAPGVKCVAHAQLHSQGQRWAGARRESPTRPRGRPRRSSPSGPMSRARGRRA